MNEIYAAIIVSAAIFILIICIASPLLIKSQAQDDAILRMRETKKEKLLRDRRNKLDIAAKISEWRTKSKERIATRNVQRVDINETMKKADRKMVKQLAAANVSLTLKQFTAVQFGLGILLATLNIIIGTKLGLPTTVKIYSCFLSLLEGIVIPKIIVKKRKKKREEILLDSMPDAMDLISISTSSGLGFESSVLKIAEKSNSPCIQELKIVINDIQHGVPKKDAYLAMQERCNLKEMTGLVTAILQSDELGAPIADVLNEQAEVLRDNKRIRAEERANKAPVKITIPLVFCIFPAILIVILAPAVYQIMQLNLF